MQRLHGSMTASTGTGPPCAGSGSSSMAQLPSFARAPAAGSGAGVGHASYAPSPPSLPQPPAAACYSSSHQLPAAAPPSLPQPPAAACYSTCYQQQIQLCNPVGGSMAVAAVSGTPSDIEAGPAGAAHNSFGYSYGSGSGPHRGPASSVAISLDMGTEIPLGSPSYGAGMCGRAGDSFAPPTHAPPAHLDRVASCDPRLGAT